LRGAGLTTVVFALLLGHSDAGCLPLPAGLLLHLRDTEQNGREHLAYGSVEVDLLRNAHNTQSFITPLAEDVDPVRQTTAKAVQLVRYDGPNLAREHGGLHLFECGALQVVTTLTLVHIPSDGTGSDAVAGQPSFDFRPLPGFILADRRDAD